MVGQGSETTAGPKFGSRSYIDNLSTPGLDIKLDGDQAKKYLPYAFGINAGKEAINGLLISSFNYCLKSEEIEAEKDVAVKYYDTKLGMAKEQSKVALHSIDSQMHATNVQQDMHRTQTSHEQEMMRLESGLKVKLAKIAEGGRTERAKILNMVDAFSRRNRFRGNPSRLSA